MVSTSSKKNLKSQWKVIYKEINDLWKSEVAKKSYVRTECKEMISSKIC